MGQKAPRALRGAFYFLDTPGEREIRYTSSRQSRVGLGPPMAETGKTVKPCTGSVEGQAVAAPQL